MSDNDNISDFLERSSVSFGFLERDYGFSRASWRPHRLSVVVRYESASIYVLLSSGPPNFEPEMLFGRKGIDEEPVSFGFEAGDLIELERCRDWRANLDKEDQLFFLARLLEVCGKQCLHGKDAVFDEMRTRRLDLIRAERTREEAELMTRQLDDAWRAKNYKRMVELAEGRDSGLTELERKRVIYARQHL